MMFLNLNQCPSLILVSLNQWPTTKIEFLSSTFPLKNMRSAVKSYYRNEVSSNYLCPHFFFLRERNLCTHLIDIDPMI